MNSLIFKYFFFLITVIGFSTCMAQENIPIRYHSRAEVINVIDKEKGYTSTITYKGRVGAKPLKIQIPYLEYEKIDSLEIKYKTANSNFIKLSPGLISDQSIITDGASNKTKAKLFDLKPNVYFEYSYKVYCSELPYLSVLDLNSETTTDTFEYSISVPGNYKLTYELPSGSDKNTTITSDSIAGNRGNTYKFKSINKRKFEFYQGYIKEFERPLLKVPQIKLFVLPVDSENQFSFFNESFKDLYFYNSNLNSESIGFFEHVFDEISNKDSLISAVFGLLKEKINCVSLDNCLKLKQVKDVNKILTDKSGSCKDISILMCVVFKYFGFDAKLALASSATATYDIDFPGLCCADHIICVINHKGIWHYLDPSEPIYIPGIPPALIQGRHIFILGEKEGIKHKVEILPAAKNLTKLEAVINVESNVEYYPGNYSIETKGQQTLALIKGYRQLYSDNFKNGILKRFMEESKGFDFKSINAIRDGDKLLLKGVVFLPRKFLMTIGNRNYLSLKFLPFPHDLPQKASEKSDLITFKSLNNHYSVILKFPKPIQLIEEETSTYNENGFEFNMQIKQNAENELTITYFYYYDNVLVTNEKIKTYNKINTYIKDLFGRMVYFDNLVTSEISKPDVKSEEIKERPE